jgi:hypothetical protein
MLSTNITAFVTFSLISFAVVPLFHADVTQIGDAEPKGEEEADKVIDLYDPILRLNRVSFHKTILKAGIAEWIVSFCPAWFTGCELFEQGYRPLAHQWETELNTAWLHKRVRFGAVDCAVDKPLCNTQKVDMYPYVVHYVDGKAVARWRPMEKSPRFSEWLKQRLGDDQSNKKSKKHQDTVASQVKAFVKETLFDTRSIRGANFLIICGLIIGNIWFVFRIFFHESGRKAPAWQGDASISGSKRPYDVAHCIPQAWHNERQSLEL